MPPNPQSPPYPPAAPQKRSGGSTMLWVGLVLLGSLLSCCIGSGVTYFIAEETRPKVATGGSGPTPVGVAPSEPAPSGRHPIELELEPDAEPPLRLWIESAGDTVPAVVGRTVSMGEGPDAREVTVRLHDERIFSHAGLRFSYPRHYTFDADLGPQMNEWVLSGNDHKIMVFHYPGQTDHATVRRSTVGEMMRRYGGGAKRRPASRTLGGRTYSGTRIDATVAGASFVQTVLSFAAGGDGYILVLQDFEPGGSEEGREAEAMLEKTFSAP